MALDKTGLKASIKQAFEDQRSNTDDPDAALDDLAGKIADAVEVFVKTGTVSTTVATTGTATAQTGTGTGNIT